jgi:hypothetical protein
MDPERTCEDEEPSASLPKRPRTFDTASNGGIYPNHDAHSPLARGDYTIAGICALPLEDGKGNEGSRERGEGRRERRWREGEGGRGQEREGRNEGEIVSLFSTADGSLLPFTKELDKR